MPQIKQKLRKVSVLSLAMGRTKISTPEEDQLARFVQAEQRSDFTTIFEILRTAANAKVAEKGCEAVWNLAALNDDNSKELGRI